MDTASSEQIDRGRRWAFVRIFFDWLGVAISTHTHTRKGSDMANWYGAARSNYVKVKDEQAFRDAMASLAVEVVTHGEGADTTFAVLARTDDGGWPSSRGIDDEDDDELDIAFALASHLADGEVLVLMQCGHEKMRYLDGYAEAIRNDGERVCVSLNDIYQLAAKTFGVEVTRATY